MKYSLPTPLRLLAIVVLAAIPLVIPIKAAAVDASISISPASQSITKGSSVTFTVNVDHGSSAIRTWDAYITYPTGIFSGGSVSAAAGSPFNLPLDYTVANGAISLSYGTLNGTSAYNYSGPLVTVTLNSIAAGTASLAFGPRCTDDPGQQNCNSAKTIVTVNGNDVTTNVIGATAGATIIVNNPATTPSGSTGGSTGTTSGGSTSTSKGGTSKATGSTTKPSTGNTPNQTPTNSNNPATSQPTDKNDTSMTETEAPTQATVTLTLLDQDGEPVAGAKVTVSGVSGTTDKNGKVTLNGVEPGSVKGQVAYKGKTQAITLNIEDGASDPRQAAKVTLKVEKSSAATPIAITVGTLAVIGVIAFVLVGPGKGLSNLANKLPGKGKGGPKPPATTPSAGPTPPPSAPTTPTTPQTSNAATRPQPLSRPQSTLPKHVDPLAPGTTFTPNGNPPRI